MKKVLVLFVFVLCATTTVCAQSVFEIPFTVEHILKGGADNPLPKSPVRPPKATLENHLLTIITSHPDYTLTLLNEDGDVVWQTFVPEDVSTVTLPDALTGDYELRLYPDSSNYYFYGDITL